MYSYISLLRKCSIYTLSWNSFVLDIFIDFDPSTSTSASTSTLPKATTTTIVPTTTSTAAWRVDNNYCVDATGKDLDEGHRIDGASTQEECKQHCSRDEDCSGYEWYETGCGDYYFGSKKVTLEPPKCTGHACYLIRSTDCVNTDRYAAKGASGNRVLDGVCGIKPGMLTDSKHA